MLNKILSITGKPGLFLILTHTNKNLIVEELQTKKRFPVSMRDKVVSLGDIAMYTTSEDKPLPEIMDLVYEHFEGKPIDVKKLVETKQLKATFKEIIPDFDEDRVRDNDIKKLFTWYNILTAAGYSKFTEEKGSEENKSEEAKTEEKES